jgi:hypothetical protein
MTRKLKLPGLAFLVVLAISAVVPSLAAAETFVFSSDATSTTYTGEAEGTKPTVLVSTVGTVACEKATYTGSQSEAEASQFEITPTYSGCTAFGFPAEIKMNECKYRYTSGTIEGSAFEGSMDIVCPEGKQMTVIAASAGTTKCTLSIGSQNGLGSVTFANVGSPPSDITASLNLSGIQYSHTKGTGIGACTSGSSSSGTRAGTDVFRGEGVHEGKTEEVGIAVDVHGTAVSIAPNQLNFEMKKAGDTGVFTITNNYRTTKYFSSIKVVDVTEAVEEKEFAISANTCGAALNSTESCQVTIKFESGIHPRTRFLRVKWGGWWPWSTLHTIKGDILS